MKIEKQPLDNQQVKLIVEVDPEQLNEARRKAARDIAKRTKIPGFRPGKAPYNIVERAVGKDAIQEQALELLVNDIYPKVIEEADIKPYGPGRLENMTQSEPPVFEFVVPLQSEVELTDYKAIRQSYEQPTVQDKEIQDVLKNIQERHAIVEPAERPAQEGDQVYIKISGERKNPEEGEVATLIRERPMTIIIQPENPEDAAQAGMEWPYPGFSRQLIGMQAGDEKEIDYAFPEDSPFELLRGKEAVYHVNVEEVKSRVLPEINDELAQGEGDYADLDALRTDIREKLQEQKTHEYNDDYDQKVIDELVEGSQIKFPPQMLEEEIDSVLRQLENRLAQQGMDMDTYLKSRQMDMKALREELKPAAESRLKRFLVLFEIARQEDVQVPPQEVQNETMETINQIFGQMNPKEARKAITNDMISSLASNITADLMIHKTMDRMRDIARGLPPKLEPIQDQAEAGEGSQAEVQNPATAEEVLEADVPETIETEPGAGEGEAEK